MRFTAFKNICRYLKEAETGQLTRTILPMAKTYIEKHGQNKLPVIWLETNDSGDNNIAFMNTTYPYLGEVFDTMIDLLYSNTFMAAQGNEAWHLLHRAAQQYDGRFVLVVEGAIPLKDEGLYTVIARVGTRSVTALQAVNWLGPRAKYVLALGTCASFGGPTSAQPNITGSAGVGDVLGREVINVSGCPVNPDWFVGTLAHLLMFGKPELDADHRPKLFYGHTVHQHCQRRSYFDKKDFAERLGDKECMFSLGCAGPRTFADCPYRQWINYVNWPVRANTPCIGCTNKSFPDGSAPFFTPLPHKKTPPKRETPEGDVT